MTLLKMIWHKREIVIAVIAILTITAHLIMRFGMHTDPDAARVPLLVCLFLGGTPLVLELVGKALRREFGSDLLAGISIVTSVLLGEYLAGSIVVLMLSGGEALEEYAVANASSVLKALAKRMPSVAHLKSDGTLTDVPLEDVKIGDHVTIFPHETSPVDGIVIDGHGVMDESFLTGEPYMMSKAPGSSVISGSINGESAITIEATRPAQDSRYAKIMQVMRDTEQRKPKMRRLGDQLGAIYTPIAVALALIAWTVSGDPTRFLAVLVVATPCPLLIGIPVAIIGSISLSAKRGIVIKDPGALEVINTCKTIIFDKTGTLTYGTPVITDIIPAPGIDERALLSQIVSLERYSKHPLADAIVRRGEELGVSISEPNQVSEKPGQGLSGLVAGTEVLITGRKALAQIDPEHLDLLPERTAGLECVVVLDGQYAATVQFRDEPRKDGKLFIEHLSRKHGYEKVMLVSGDRQSEADYLGQKVGIREIIAEQTPEQKVEIVRSESEHARTCFVGDGINDAPALSLATVGIAFGQASDITTEAAGVVIMDSSLERVDEFFHISKHMRRIALQSAIGGMLLSMVGMILAAMGYLPPVAGAISQEIIDVLAVVNALRAAWPPRVISDIRDH
ncbi:MAG TPA: cadmium-translocating P-type ATPase [Phycisphaerales bacterium]|nr:cadmium-translocating P-type ATPase [Phycisphaerae bacterium]HCT43989.1 cadmium-translocating P-type ATPase [Phycisphaerales bacterium]